MSERSYATVNAVYDFPFWALTPAGAAITGLVSGSFTKKLSAGYVNSAQTVTVTEVDSTNLPGLYRASYTPNAAGVWDLRLFTAANAAGWQDTVQATTSGGPDVNVVSIATAGVNAMLDLANTIDGVATLRQAFQWVTATLAGKNSAGSTRSVPVFLGLDNATTRVTATVDANTGQRTAVTRS